MITTYEEALSYINDFTWSKSRLGLKRTRELLYKLGDPQKKLKFIHVAGTNGKGSICAMTERILREAGYRTGFYPSPYLEDFRERIQVNGELITKEALTRITERVASVADMMEDHPSQFELITAIGMLYFLEQECDFVVLEVGMGGRWDATNVLDADAAVIGPIDMDHMAWLGDTVEQIAAEKVGIIKPGCTAIIGRQPHEDEVMPIIEQAAAENHATLVRDGVEAEVVARMPAVGGQMVTLRTPNGTYADVPLDKFGEHQAHNALAALCAAEVVIPVTGPLDGDLVGEALSSVKIPGRIEQVRNSPTIIIDGGHNVNAAEALRAAIEEERRERKHRRRLVLGAILGTLIVLGLAYAAFTFLNLGNQMREVPNLLNLTEEQAVTAIVESDFFERGEITREYSDTVAEGIVVDQDPDPQRQMQRGTTIDLVISKGPEPAKSVKVPNLKNMTPSEAEAKLREVGLIGKVGDSVYDSEVEANNVATQSPTADSTAKEGDTVTYHLSKGPEDIEVPDVVGKDRFTAEEELTAAGFKVEIAYDSSDVYDEGYVFSQSATGTAKKGSTITLYVSTGVAQLEIPYVVGKDVYSATYEIQNAGFAVYTAYDYSDSIDAGYVISQSETGSAAAGTTITLVISSGPQPTNPDDPGQSEETGGDTSEETTNTTEEQG